MNWAAPSSAAGSKRSGDVPRIRTGSSELAAAEVPAASMPQKKTGKRIVRSFMSRRLLLDVSALAPVNEKMQTDRAAAGAVLTKLHKPKRYQRRV